jgi:hypothetical protein
MFYTRIPSRVKANPDWRSARLGAAIDRRCGGAPLVERPRRLMKSPIWQCLRIATALRAIDPARERRSDKFVHYFNSLRILTF